MNRTHRQWGYYDVLHGGFDYTVKELVIEAGKCLSDQRHHHRKEEWLVVYGSIQVTLQTDNALKRCITLNKGDKLTIPKKQWHLVCNHTDKEAKIIEVWMGDILREEDIERRTV